MYMEICGTARDKSALRLSSSFSRPEEEHVLPTDYCLIIPPIGKKSF